MIVILSDKDIQTIKISYRTANSQVNAEEFIDYFTPFLEKGQDILHVCLSSGLSGVINSAMIAKEELEAKYPDRSIYIVDSLGASSGYGLIMQTLSDKRKEGMPIDALYEWVEKNIIKIQN